MKYYSQEQLNHFLGIKGIETKKVIGYCRVSSNKQKMIKELLEDDKSD